MRKYGIEGLLHKNKSFHGRQSLKTIVVITIICIFMMSTIVHAEEVDFSVIFENHGLVRLIIDADTGAIEYANQAAVDFYGYAKEELLAMTIQEINTLAPELVEEERRAAYREDRNFFIFKHRLASGEVKTVEVHSYPVLHEGKETLYSVVIDITPRVLLEESLERSRRMAGYLIWCIVLLLLILAITLYLSRENYKKLANEDPLTGAYSRLYLDKWVEKNQHEIGTKEPTSLVVIDVNDYKKINDNYGHLVGDQVLVKIVEVIRDSIGQEDSVIRYGGDEFLLILENCTEEQGHVVMKRIKDLLKYNRSLKFPIEISYGIQQLAFNQDVYRAIAMADEKMYIAKT